MCSVAKFPLCFRSFVSLPSLHNLTLVQQGVLGWCPAQFHELADAGMVKDARPLFIYFMQHGSTFVSLCSWLLYSLFPVLKLKQQRKRDDSELPAVKNGSEFEDD